MPFNIEFDYRFDTNGFFNDPARRQALEAAANIWESYIQDEFPDVGPGIHLEAINPVTDGSVPVTLPSGIDDLSIFVGGKDLTSGAAGFGGPSSGATGTIFQNRYFGSNFEPHIGQIVFDTNPNLPNGNPSSWFFDPTPETANDIPSQSFDFISVALHEIGHVLGVGTAPIFNTLGESSQFKGPNAIRVNIGQPIPLENDLGHIKEGFPNGSPPVLMDPSAAPGRTLPTQYDLAILADIGYEIPGYQAQGSTPPIATEAADQISGTVLNDTILGLSGDDVMLGQQDNDALFANRGNDQIQGASGDDVIYGGRDNDNLFGQEGNDFLSGDRGNDYLEGGTGRDTFVFRAESGSDNIFGFNVAEDIIQIAVGLGFNTGTDVLGAITNNGPLTSGGIFTEITLSPGNTITISSDIALTAANFTIAGPTTL